MLPGNDLILICPMCGAPKKVMSLLSGNTFGAVCWSDGYCYSPLLLRNTPVQRCKECGRYFWIREDERPIYADTSECEPSLLSSGEWMEALRQFKEEESFTAEQERIIRLNLLWTLNHVDSSEKDPDMFRNNNRELLRLLCPLQKEDILLCAELYRENGNFHGCVRLLGYHEFPEGRQKRIAESILEAAGRHDMSVFRLLL